MLELDIDNNYNIQFIPEDPSMIPILRDCLHRFEIKNPVVTFTQRYKNDYYKEFDEEKINTYAYVHDVLSDFWKQSPDNEGTLKENVMVLLSRIINTYLKEHAELIDLKELMFPSVKNTDFESEDSLFGPVLYASKFSSYLHKHNISNDIIVTNYGYNEESADEVAVVYLKKNNETADSSSNKKITIRFENEGFGEYTATVLVDILSNEDFPTDLLLKTFSGKEKLTVKQLQNTDICYPIDHFNGGIQLSSAKIYLGSCEDRNNMNYIYEQIIKIYSYVSNKIQ